MYNGPVRKRKRTRQINTIQNHCRERLHRSDYELFSWQKSYHDRIIRNENELNRIRQYIIDNPKKWEDDEVFNK